MSINTETIGIPAGRSVASQHQGISGDDDWWWAIFSELVPFLAPASLSAVARTCKTAARAVRIYSATVECFHTEMRFIYTATQENFAADMGWFLDNISPKMCARAVSFSRSLDRNAADGQMLIMSRRTGFTAGLWWNWVATALRKFFSGSQVLAPAWRARVCVFISRIIDSIPDRDFSITCDDVIHLLSNLDSWRGWTIGDLGIGYRKFIRDALMATVRPRAICLGEATNRWFIRYTEIMEAFVDKFVATCDCRAPERDCGRAIGHNVERHGPARTKHLMQVILTRGIIWWCSRGDLEVPFGHHVVDFAHLEALDPIEIRPGFAQASTAQLYVITSLLYDSYWDAETERAGRSITEARKHLDRMIDICRHRLEGASFNIMRSLRVSIEKIIQELNTRPLGWEHYFTLRAQTTDVINRVNCIRVQGRAATGHIWH